MQAIKKFAAVVAAAATAAAGFPSSPVLAQARLIPTSATLTAPVDQTALISSTIRAFPNGGEALKIAIADLIVRHPNLANDLAAYVKNDPSLTAEQKQAIVAGLADALNRQGVIAQVGGMSPALVALLVVGGGLIGLGIYQVSRNNNNTVSPH